MSSLDFWGSTLVMKAESKEKVIETLKADPYTKADVWDWDKVSEHRPIETLRYTDTDDTNSCKSTLSGQAGRSRDQCRRTGTKKFKVIE